MRDVDDVAARSPITCATVASTPGRSGTSMRGARADPIVRAPAAAPTTARGGRCCRPEHDTDVAAAEALRVLDQRGEPGGARALDDGLLDLGRERDRSSMRCSGDDEQIVDESPDDRRASACPGS